MTGSAAGSGADLSGLVGTLENGQAANVLGGIGSGLAWAGGSTFVAIPDRGPNAVCYDSAIDDTTSYIARMQTVQMTLTPNAAHTAFTLTPTLTATTLFNSPTPLSYGAGGLGKEKSGAALRAGAPAENAAGRYYFAGRSDNYGAGNSGNAANARLDPEGVRVANDGKSVFIADEYGPYLYQFDRTTGARIRTFTLPANLDVANLTPAGATEISGNASGRTANNGMEGLAITPDGKTMVGMMQAALLQDAGAASKLLRIVAIGIATGTTHEHA